MRLISPPKIHQSNKEYNQTEGYCYCQDYNYWSPWKKTDINNNSFQAYIYGELRQLVVDEDDNGIPVVIFI